jgi:hypothetical protein
MLKAFVMSTCDSTEHIRLFEYCAPLMSQPHFWKSVRMTLTLLKWGLGSPLGLSKFQSSTAGVKTLHLEAFFMLLESY